MPSNETTRDSLIEAQDFNPQFYILHVHFDANKGDPFHYPNGHTINTSSWASLVVLRMTVEEGQIAELTPAVSWYYKNPDGRLIGRWVPSNFVVVRYDEHQLIFWNLNATRGESKVFSFSFTVLCGNKVYSSGDPTIINEEPPT